MFLHAKSCEKFYGAVNLSNRWISHCKTNDYYCGLRHSNEKPATRYFKTTDNFLLSDGVLFLQDNFVLYPLIRFSSKLIPPDGIKWINYGISQIWCQETFTYFCTRSNFLGGERFDEGVKYATKSCLTLQVTRDNDAGMWYPCFWIRCML